MSICSNCGNHKAEYDTRKGEESVCYFCDEGAVIVEPDQFLCKRIDKEFKEKVIARCNYSIKNCQSLADGLEWNTFDNSERKDYLDKVEFYKKLLDVISSIEPLDQKGADR